MNKKLSVLSFAYVRGFFHQSRTFYYVSTKLVHVFSCRNKFCTCIVLNFTCLHRPFLSRHAWNTTLKAFHASIGRELVMQPLETFTRLWNQAPRFVQVTIASLLFNLKVILKGAHTQPQYFELFWSGTKLSLNWRKPKNSSLPR